MASEALWADYARIQTAAKLAASITHSDANDVRLDRILEGITLGRVEAITGIERAVKSRARRERSRQSARRLTEHAFTPLDMANPEQTLIWKQAWMHFERAFSKPELRLLTHSETVTTPTPMTGADRTRLVRIRSSTMYRTAQAVTFS